LSVALNERFPVQGFVPQQTPGQERLPLRARFPGSVFLPCSTRIVARSNTSSPLVSANQRLNSLGSRIIDDRCARCTDLALLALFSAHRRDGSSCIRLSAFLYCMPVKATPCAPTCILCPPTYTSSIGLFFQWRVWTTVAAAPTSGRGSWLPPPQRPHRDAAAGCPPPRRCQRPFLTTDCMPTTVSAYNRWYCLQWWGR